MSDQCMDTLRCNPSDLHQAMSIHTKKITDACRDKDCIEDLRVYLTEGSQILLDAAKNVRVRSADLLDARIHVEPMAFDRNHFCIDVTFFYRIQADAVMEPVRTVTLTGLAVFSKRAVLCGEESSARSFTSSRMAGSPEDVAGNREGVPQAVADVLDPMVLGYRVRETCECRCQEDTVPQIPDCIRQCFDEELMSCGDRRRLYVTLGQFSVIRLERDAQLIVPVLDYSLPAKECRDACGCSEDPCELFSRIPFPEQKFSPRGCDCEDKKPR